MPNIAEQTIKMQISTLDRSDKSQVNIQKARHLLKFTGRATQYCTLFLKNGKEIRTAWFQTRERAKQALDILVAKGFQSMIYTD